MEVRSPRAGRGQLRPRDWGTGSPVYQRNECKDWPRIRGCGENRGQKGVRGWRPQGHRTSRGEQGSGSARGSGVRGRHSGRPSKTHRKFWEWTWARAEAQVRGGSPERLWWEMLCLVDAGIPQGEAGPGEGDKLQPGTKGLRNVTRNGLYRQRAKH